MGTGPLRESVLTAWRGSPTRFREDANAEEDLRLGSYRDRLLVELAQNAADAAMLGGVPGTLRLSVVDRELRAANTGAPLDRAGVAALASLRASAKRAEQSVGKFGVGFAAVLAVSDAPRVVSGENGVAFSAERTRQTLAGLPEIADQFADRGGQVPVLRLVWPVELTEDPPPAGFDTEVRLPLRAGIDGDALLADFAAQAPDLLLALPGLSQVEVGGQRWWREEAAEDTVSLHGPDGVTNWLLHRTSGELAEEVVRKLGVEDQKRPQWTVCWAVQLRGEVPVPLDEDVLHAPTPTDERLSLPARLLATLPVESSRRRLLPGPAADAVLAEAARAYPDLLAKLPEAQRTALVPLPGFPLSEVDGRLRELVLAGLRTAQWLPLAGGGEVAPARAKVLDAVSPELVDLLKEDVSGLLVAELAEPRHSKPLAALEVPRLGTAEVVAIVTNLRNEPSWWRRLYAALDPIAEVDSQAREELGSLPVPLSDDRTVLGPRGVLLPETDGETLELLSTVDVSGLRIAHPDAVHPLLERLGARPAGPHELLDSEPLMEAVRRSVEEAESGAAIADPADLADAVLRLVDRAGVRQGEQPWLAALALPSAEGDWRRADELVLPGSPLLDVFDPSALAEDGPLAVLDADAAADWPRDVLVAVGCLDSFAVVVDETPTDPDHDLADEEDWWEHGEEPPTRLVGVRDLDLVADDRWPVALRMLADNPVTRRALRDPDGYSSWWLARHALLEGRPPRAWRLPAAETVAGLYDVLPPVGLDEELLTDIGVRAGLVVAEPDDAVDLLGRLADPERSVRGGVVLRVHAALAEGLREGVLEANELELPEHVRALSGSVVEVGPVVVLDSPWLLGVLPADQVAAGEPGPGVPEALAELLDLPLASEAVVGELVEQGEPVSWRELGAVALACELLGVPVPDGVIVVHDELMVTSAGAKHQVPWWVDDNGQPHAEDSAEGLARALAWVTDRWTDRHAFAALIADPTPVNLLG
ncbi:hypothetical protein F0L68_10850 [Solihabitans fulvus]|uniref:Molecular chaperone Hsp90 n=1 Tax=Solihabitans fulvus TaxID=1892852 RepID=A0A5B2XJ59_9PSEU|nr:hypothetical protein F0L68_10850 [Solihabitans fulvus]